MSEDKCLQGRIPDSYTDASWRNTTPVDAATDSIGLGFDVEPGKTVRLRLSLESARAVQETLAEFLCAHDAKEATGQ